MAAVGIRNRRVLKLLLNPWFRRSKVKRFVTAGKLHKLIIIIDLLRETKIIIISSGLTRSPTPVVKMCQFNPNAFREQLQNILPLLFLILLAHIFLKNEKWAGIN